MNDFIKAFFIPVTEFLADNNKVLNFLAIVFCILSPAIYSELGSPEKTWPKAITTGVGTALVYCLLKKAWLSMEEFFHKKSSKKETLRAIDILSKTEKKVLFELAKIDTNVFLIDDDAMDSFVRNLVALECASITLNGKARIEPFVLKHIKETFTEK